MASDAAVRSLVVPTVAHNLLLPSSVVAEIVGYADPTPPLQESPKWLQGSMLWREQRIPLIAFDVLHGGDAGVVGGRTRIAVIKALGNKEDMPYFGIVSQQIPRLLNVQEEGLEPLNEASEADEFGTAVLAHGEPALIPDLERLEAMLYKELNP